MCNCLQNSVTTVQIIGNNFTGFENFSIFISVLPLEIEQGRK